MLNKKKKTLYILDAMALAYRAYFAFFQNPLRNSKGENVGAVFGFANTLLNILDQEKPDYFAVAFDTKEPTFRHEMYTEYKANRAEMPEDMTTQIPHLYNMLEYLGVPVVKKPGYEADDIMGTLARLAEENDLQTVMVTGDKDMMQLITKNVFILNPKRSGQEPEWMDSKAVTEKIGLGPEQIIDYLALMGDSSDNVPGVPGIGPKTAAKLLQEHGSLEAVLENAESVKNKRARESLVEHKEQAILSQKLVTIDCHVPLDVNPTELVVKEPDNEKASAFFQEMEFRSLTDRFSPEQEKVEKSYNCILNEQDFANFVKKLASQKTFAFDTETTSVDPLQADLVGLSFSWKKNEGWYIPVAGPNDLAAEEHPLDLKSVLNALKPILENPEIEKCAHNAKYDIHVLGNYDIKVAGLAFDTMVASYVVNPSLRQHNLDALALSHLGLKKIPTSDLIGSGVKQITMEKVPIKTVGEYACEDADVTWQLWDIFNAKLDELELTKLFETVELPLISVLGQMERNGVLLDDFFLAGMSKELDVDLKKLELKIYELGGGKFNIQSPKQLGTILFERLGLPPVRKTKTGYSTDVSVLETLANQHDLPKLILDYRQFAKLKSTYVDALPKLINPRTGRVHTSYNQTVAATGRLSSNDPNLQNIPIRTEIGRSIRKAFIPTDNNHTILDADYSQIELRIMAHLSGDKELQYAFQNDIDVHTRTAALVFGVGENEVTSDQRRKAKEVNFGIMYGMGAFGLANRLGISNGEANEFIQTYYASYPGVHKFMKDIVEEAKENGYVKTMLNRRRYLPEISSSNKQVRDFGERTAINTPIQGTAADLIKVAMINIQQKMNDQKLNTKMILQVHDELVFDVPNDELDVMKELVTVEMESAMELSVPIKVEMDTGQNWLEAH